MAAVESVIMEVADDGYDEAEADEEEDAEVETGDPCEDDDEAE